VPRAHCPARWRHSFLKTGNLLVSSVNMQGQSHCGGRIAPGGSLFQELIATGWRLPPQAHVPGARPPSANFTEETVTVLIFERGAVIRLLPV
jgi:hypothetical protein